MNHSRSMFTGYVRGQLGDWQEPVLEVSTLLGSGGVVGGSVVGRVVGRVVGLVVGRGVVVAMVVGLVVGGGVAGQLTV